MDPAEIDMLRRHPRKLDETNIGLARGPIEGGE